MLVITSLIGSRDGVFIGGKHLHHTFKPMPHISTYGGSYFSAGQISWVDRINNDYDTDDLALRSMQSDKDTIVRPESDDFYVFCSAEEGGGGDSIIVNEGDDYVYVDSEEEEMEAGEVPEPSNSEKEASGEPESTYGKLLPYEVEKSNYLDFWNYDAVNWYTKEDQLTDSLIQFRDTYQEKAQLMQHAPKESEFRPESQVNPVGVGYSEVEWTYFTDNIGAPSGPGATTFFTGYTNGTIFEGLDSSTVDVVNKIIDSAMPGGAYI